MEIFIIIVLLIIAAETTYLTIGSNRKNGRLMQSPVFVDTSVLIDGRIVAVAESGFVLRPLYIPRSVVGELQFLADNADTEKRTRARHGLDVVSELQNMPSVKVIIFNDGTRAADGVDNRLLELAKKNGGAICTIDYNLNKVAIVEGIQVLNVNELAKSLRMAYLPGEVTTIELTQKGNDSHQGIGHLSDGTMVVVEHAYKQIGSKVEIEFIRGLQTAAGKMMFARLTHPAERPNGAQKTGNAKKPVAKVIGRRAPAAAASKPDVESVVQTLAPAETKPQRQPRQPQGQAQPAQRPPRQPRQQAQKQQKGAQEQPQQPQMQGSEQSAKPVRQQANKRPNNRRRSPEDSMVELANRSQDA
mgnify:CR=1 FL=1